MTQRHQRGSIISFVVVGVLLTIAVVGGIYLVKNQLNGNMPNLAGGDDQVAQVEEEAEDSEPSDTTDEATDDQAEQSQDESTTDQTADDEAVGQDDFAASDDEAATTTDEDPYATDEEVADESTDEATIPQTGVAAETLPQTGAADNLYALVALGALVASVVAYRRSNIL